MVGWPTIEGLAPEKVDAVVAKSEATFVSNGSQLVPTEDKPGG
jgi:hypothetical protein